MDCSASRIPYRQTNSFSKIILDYIDQSAALKPFFTHPPSLTGIQKAIDARRQHNNDRELLVKELKTQYQNIPGSAPVQKNIEALLSANTFTVSTAHQNNIFTGPIFFVYKILHTIRLADHLNKVLPGNQFVPVFYMGTEDADLEELNHIYLQGEKLVWDTKQTGAVGRMKVDKELTKLIELISGQLSVLPKGDEIISLVKDCYNEGMTIQETTFRLVNTLFAGYGLVILLPDNAAFKKQMLAIFEDELFNQPASGIVEKTAESLTGAGYKAQANPREINLFYLKEDMRERIIKKQATPAQTDALFNIQNSALQFSEKEMKAELHDHPERFSPNVILRGLYQETILPDIAFIGGGGELAYWLQVKGLFEHYKTSFPVLVLRNSFLIVEKKWQSMISKMGFTAEDFFLPEEELINRLVARQSGKKLQLNGTLTETERLYEEIKKQVASIDITLEKHVDSLRMKTLHHLQELEKKMLRAEKENLQISNDRYIRSRNIYFPGMTYRSGRKTCCIIIQSGGGILLISSTSNPYNWSRSLL